MKKIIRVKVIKEYLNLKDILPMGFETELIISLSDKDEVVLVKQYVANKFGYVIGKGIVIGEQIIPSGNYQGFKFKGVNKKTCNGSTIRNSIGYIPMNKIFEKI